MHHLVIVRRWLGRALMGALCLVGFGCHQEPDSPAPDLGQLPASTPVVDYAKWPLARLESALAPPECAQPVPQQRYFRSLTPDDASGHGFGMVDALVRLAQLGVDAPASCPYSADEARSGALNQAITIFLNDATTKSAYGRYGECMVDHGVDGAANPMEAELLVLKRYSTTLMDAGVGAGPTDGAQVAVPETKVLDHQDELLTYERRVAMTSVRCQAATIASEADSLIATQQKVIDSAPANQKALLDG